LPSGRQIRKVDIAKGGSDAIQKVKRRNMSRPLLEGTSIKAKGVKLEWTLVGRAQKHEGEKKRITGPGVSERKGVRRGLVEQPRCAR